MKKFNLKRRKDNEPPFTVSKLGLHFHHIGIPTSEIKPNEKYFEQYKFYVSGFNKSKYGIEWMRFEKDSPITEIIQTVPHIAFEVDNIEASVKGKKMIRKISSPSNRVSTAMIIENGAPVECQKPDYSPGLGSHYSSP